MNYNTALVQLPLVRETGKQRIMTSENVRQACADIANLAQECFQVLCLNTRHILINRHMVTLGLLDSALVHPREVFRPAIEDSAAAVVLVHNHPSGDATPSAEDLRITRQLIETGKIIDIKVLDHVVIGRPAEPVGDASPRPAYLSLREAGLCSFT